MAGRGAEPGGLPMTQKEISQAIDRLERDGDWIRGLSGTISLGAVRDLTGESFHGIPIGWVLQISYSGELSDRTKEAVRGKVPGIPIEWVRQPAG
jgi:hypothetical protein